MSESDVLHCNLVIVSFGRHLPVQRKLAVQQQEATTASKEKQKGYFD